MTAHKGFAPLLVILVVAVIAVVGAGGAALLGQAPQCPAQTSSARSEKELADILDKKGSVTTTDGEATTIAQIYVGDKIQSPRVCFTQGLAHASGNISIGPLTPSFYASAGIDLSGTTPNATNLEIKVGSMPNIPVISTQVESVITNLINDNLAKVQLNKKYSVQFSNGFATVTKLAN